MNQEMTRSLRGLGDALAKTYFHEWLTEKKRIDRYLEDVVLNSPLLKSDRVQGGDHVTPQERLQEIKEEHEGYQTLSRNIGRMEAFLDGLNDDERALVDLYYRQEKDFLGNFTDAKKGQDRRAKKPFHHSREIGRFLDGRKRGGVNAGA